MADDGMSASQLRQRYGRGGTAADSDLSASQLRGRYGVENKQFGQSNDNTMQMIVGAAVCFVVMIGMLFYLKSAGH
ncbi:hypothetical protein T484DRAFT_1964936 [Baffinella frigidus]|nr:hypothetical protein T484DRAFT_1964936 [Cryptophyta sp. CCMP2293]